MDDLTSKVAVITGGSSGIGYALATPSPAYGGGPTVGAKPAGLELGPRRLLGRVVNGVRSFVPRRLVNGEPGHVEERTRSSHAQPCCEAEHAPQT
jgi:hypothetical protein